MNGGRGARTAALLVAPVLLLGACGTSGPVARPAPSPSPTATPSATASPEPTRTAAPTPTRTAQPTTQPTAAPTTAAPVGAAVLVRRLPTTAKVVALTFDAGSDAGSAAQVLDLLRAQGIRAAFGLTGAWVRANPALARRVVAEGHLVVNHSDRHLSFTGRSTGSAPLTTAERQQQLLAAEAAIRAATGAGTRPWFRPPYGDRDASVDRDVAAVGWTRELLWTVDTLGWKGVPPSEVLARVLAAAEPGEVVLMHVGAASTDARALPSVITELRRQGYRFVRPDAV